MKKLMIIAVVIILVIVAFISIPKFVKVNIGDGGLLSKEPCGPDCFFGISPSLSTQNDVEIQLAKYKLRKFCRISDLGEIISYLCDDVFIINITKESKLVFLVGYTPQDKVTLGSIINKYGDPDFLVTYEVGTTPEYPVTLVRMYYEKYNMSIETNKQEGNFLSINSDLMISNVGYSRDFPELNYPNISKQPWRGYGDYFNHTR